MIKKTETLIMGVYIKSSFTLFLARFGLEGIKIKTEKLIKIEYVGLGFLI